MERHLSELKEEGHLLGKPPSSDPAAMTPAMRKAIDEVTRQIQTLNQHHQDFMTLCQQKRDFYIVAVKFHMTVRQVRQSSCVYCILSTQACQPVEKRNRKISDILNVSSIFMSYDS